MDAQINNEPGSQRLAGDSGPRAAGDDGNLLIGGVFDKEPQVVFIAWGRHREGLDLEQAGVGGIKPARNPVREQFPSEMPSKVVAQAPTLRIHRVSP
jgi:hypothetical protein